jgi:hypothetical protein
LSTWKKIIVSGSDAHLTSVSASVSIGVNNNQIIGTTQNTTQLTGSFTGSFVGNGNALTNINSDNLTLPTTAFGTINTNDKFLVYNTGNGYITLTNLLNQLAGPNLQNYGGNSLTLQPDIIGLNSINANSFTGSLKGTATTASYVLNSISSSYALSSSYSINSSTASYAIDAVSSSFATNALTASYYGGGVSIANSGDNRVITSTGTSTGLNGEVHLTFNGSTLLVVGNVEAQSFTGSLQGTASNAISSSYATTSSYVLTAVSSSFATTASFASSSPAVYDFGSFATPTDVGGGGNFGILTDGDKGDITVTSSGSIWTIDNDVVTYDKIQNVTTSSVLLGRATTGAGNIEEIILGSGLTLAGTTLSAAGGGGSGAQIQIDTFTTSSTWTKPAWAKYFRVYLVGGGGAGGSGARRATTSARYGGGGGAAASSVWIELTNTEITGSSVSVTIGAGGISGSSVTTDDTNGNNGGNGGATSFGSFAATYTSGGGSGGTTSAGTRGAAVSVISNYGPSATIGGQNGSNTSPGTVSGLSNQSLSYTGNFGGAGGAGAAGSSTTTATGGTIDYWSPILPSVAVSSGGTNGGNGNDGVSFTYGYFTVGTPGGGGSYKTGQATGRGGDASFGAGGGGGAASDNGFASGRGGNGGNGICVVISIG